MSQFVDDKLEYIESDIEKIQMKTGMYVSWVGKKGALHLSREIIQNSIDEAENKKSPCKNIDIELDTLSDTLRVEDDGRGIPEDEFPLDIVCTKLQSGSKFTREQGGNSSGENGVGLTACNALASKFSLATFREGKMHEISFEEGIKVDDTRKSSKKGMEYLDEYEEGMDDDEDDDRYFSRRNRDGADYGDDYIDERDDYYEEDDREPRNDRYERGSRVLDDLHRRREEGSNIEDLE